MKKHTGATSGLPPATPPPPPSATPPHTHAQHVAGPCSSKRDTNCCAWAFVCLGWCRCFPLFRPWPLERETTARPLGTRSRYRKLFLSVYEKQNKNLKSVRRVVPPFEAPRPFLCEAAVQLQDAHIAILAPSRSCSPFYCFPRFFPLVLRIFSLFPVCAFAAPPSAPLITNAKGVEVGAVAGPFQEGYDLQLACSVTGGECRSIDRTLVPVPRSLSRLWGAG